jgi:hypothetical protein
MKRKPVLLALCLGSLLSSCVSPSASLGGSSSLDSSQGALSTSSNGSSISSNEPMSDSSSQSSTSSSGEVALPASPEYTKFWAYDSDVRLSLSFTNASLYALSYYGTHDNLKWGDVYFPADLTLTVDGTSYSLTEVGVRMKGNTSRKEFCSESGAISQASHFKISFKATFDDAIYSEAAFLPFKHDWTADPSGRTERKNRRLFDMEKIDLKYLPRNTASPYPCYSQEIYVYDRYRAAGLLASSAKWAQVHLATANDAKDYAYELVEDLDKVFLKRHFSALEAKGDLYKCTYNSMGKADFSREGAVNKNDADQDAQTRLAQGKIGVEDNYNGYHPVYDLKTNDNGEASDFSAMSRFINRIWLARYHGAPLSSLTDVLDLDWFLKYEAAAYIFGNIDDQRNNYNNFYLYFRPSDGKALYIPYDNDYSLGTIYSNIDVAHFSPYKTKANEGGDSASIYFATFLPYNTSSASGTSLAYSQAEMKATYASDIRSLVGQGFLEYSSYASFVGQLANATVGEASSVSSYMSEKKTTIAQSL